MIPAPVFTLPAAWEDAWDAYSIPRKSSLSKRTLANYRDTFIQLARFVGPSITPEQLTRRQVAAFLESVVQSTSATTAAMRYRGLSAVLGFLARSDEDGEAYLARNPMTGLRPPKTDAVPPPVLSLEDVKRLVAACKGPLLEDRRDEAMIRLLFETGIRRGELASMQIAPEWLNLREGTARVSGKTGQRIIDIGDKTTAAIYRYLKLRARSRSAKRGVEALWIGQKGALTGNGIFQALDRRFDLAGVVSSKKAHIFRHTFSHEYSLAGGHLDDLISLNGWNSPAMALRYAKSAANERARIAHREIDLGGRL